ncbi:magnesium transporter [Alkalihalobacillus sp. 1P02AB]|uniref:magnesium transporter n=1 Tax=Alkalihalobacillus sp. 1P02AB TaxID=3132260 RepID=UPI0039A719B9
MKQKLTQEELIHEVTLLLKENNKNKLLLLLNDLHPYDLAHVYQGLMITEQEQFISELPLPQLASILDELKLEAQKSLVEILGVTKTAEVMEQMNSDDLPDLLEDLPEVTQKGILSEMDTVSSEAVQKLMDYKEETAGRLMSNRFVWIPHYYTVEDAVKKLKDFAEIAKTINYLYVIDAKKNLVGVLSYRELILAETNEKIQDIMFERVVSVSVDTDQEQVAQIIQRYDLVAVPVVHNQVLVGIVTVDTMLDVVVKEATEDIEKLSAAGANIDFDTKPQVAAFRRLPWLILLLFIGLVAGGIVSSFQDSLGKVVALAFFMPMISGMTGNTGTQSLAVVVRGLTTRDINRKVVSKLIWRELVVGSMIGVICGILISFIAFVWLGELILGAVVGSTLIITLIIGTLTGTIIPLVLHKLKVDPAIASGPLITTINDILSLLIYFGIATMFIIRLM